MHSLCAQTKVYRLHWSILLTPSQIQLHLSHYEVCWA